MLRSPAHTETVVAAGGGKVGDCCTQTFAVSARVTPKYRRNIHLYILQRSLYVYTRCFTTLQF